MEVKTSNIDVEHTVIDLRRRLLYWQEGADTRIQENSVQMGRVFFYVLAQGECSGQITGVRGQDHNSRENFFSGRQRFRIAPGHDDVSALGAQELGGGQSDPGGATRNENIFVFHKEAKRVLLSLVQ